MKRFALLLCFIPTLAWGQAGIVQETSGTKITPLADITVSSGPIIIDAADPNRAALSCTNTDAVNHVRWGNSSVDVAVGQRLPAGGSIEIKNIGAVYMIAEDVDAIVSCTKELRQ